MNHTTLEIEKLRFLDLSSATRSPDEADGDVEGHHLETVPGDQSSAMASVGAMYSSFGFRV